MGNGLFSEAVNGGVAVIVAKLTFLLFVQHRGHGRSMMIAQHSHNVCLQSPGVRMFRAHQRLHVIFQHLILTFFASKTDGVLLRSPDAPTLSQASVALCRRVAVCLHDCSDIEHASEETLDADHSAKLAVEQRSF